jgi:hypothetical protein
MNQEDEIKNRELKIEIATTRSRTEFRSFYLGEKFGVRAELERLYGRPFTRIRAQLSVSLVTMYDPPNGIETIRR